MNILRSKIIRNQKTSHVTYIMTKYALTNYESIDIVIYKRKEYDRHNAFFDGFITDLKEKLTQFGEVSTITNPNHLPIKNDIILDKAYLKEDIETQNTFINNSFVDNGEQVGVKGGGDFSGNEWHRDGVGNYWSDFATIESKLSRLSRLFEDFSSY